MAAAWFGSHVVPWHNDASPYRNRMANRHSRHSLVGALATAYQGLLVQQPLPDAAADNTDGKWIHVCTVRSPRPLLLPPRHEHSRRCCYMAAAAAGSAPAPEPANVQPGRKGWKGMLPSKVSWDIVKADWKLLRANLWAVLIIYAFRDMLAFALHRGSQRITNAAAEALLGIPITSFANPWWLYLESNFLDANKGYQLLMGFFFLLALPINFLINAAAAGSAALVCTDSLLDTAARAGTAASTSGSSTSTSAAAGALPSAAAASGTASAAFTASGRGACGHVTFRASQSSASTSQAAVASAAARAKPKGLLDGLRRGLSDASRAQAAVRPMLQRLWKTDILFNLQSLPLQALCLAVVPVYWALPRLLSIQLALPVAAVEGKEGKVALERSKQLMTGFMGAYAWPFVALIAGSRLLDVAKQALLVAMPVRWWQEVIEVPIAVTLAFAIARLLLSRLQDMLPLMVYLQHSRASSVVSTAAK